MEHSEAGRRGPRDYLRAIWRRKWAFLIPVVAVPLAAGIVSLSQAPAYEAASRVLLSRQNLANSLTGATDPAIYQQDQVVTQTQADVARSPAIAARVARVWGAGLTAESFLNQSRVSTRPNSDVLDFIVRDRHPKVAERLASTYAEAYTFYRRMVDTAGIKEALKGIDRQIKSADGASKALMTALLEKQQELETMRALQTSNALITERAHGATQVEPQLRRNVAIGLVLGVGLGLLAVLLLEALDSRVRSEEEMEQTLDAPLLGRLSSPPAALQETDRLASLAEPFGPDSESIAMLRVNIEALVGAAETQVIMVTSATSGEGKSTTASNLAVGLARGGKRVILVDLDLRRPMIDRFFRLRGTKGVVDVVSARCALEDALTEVPTGFSSGEVAQGWTREGPEGSLQVLPAGPAVDAAGELLASPAIGELFRELRSLCDQVIVDVPPMPLLSDVMTISRSVDAVVLVCRAGVVRRGELQELARLMKRSPARVLGFVETGARRDSSYGYYGYGRREQDVDVVEDSSQAAEAS